MKQAYIPYWDWEDYIGGMWKKLPKDIEPAKLQLAVDFTGDHILYGSAMTEVMHYWPKTMENSLTNKAINRKAFLGHCAVCFKLGIPEYITREAWGLLSNEQRFNANMAAEKNIKNYEVEYKAKNRVIHKGLGNQMLFQWNS